MMWQQQTETSSSNLEKKRMCRSDTRDNIETEEPEVTEPCGDSYLWFCLCPCDQCTSQHVVSLCFLQLSHINAATVWSLWKKTQKVLVTKGRSGSGETVGRCTYAMYNESSYKHFLYWCCWGYSKKKTNNPKLKTITTTQKKRFERLKH